MRVLLLALAVACPPGHTCALGPAIAHALAKPPPPYIAIPPRLRATPTHPRGIPWPPR